VFSRFGWPLQEKRRGSDGDIITAHASRQMSHLVVLDERGVLDAEQVA
jgi:hypothetical protein